ncbi:MAG TPA: gliding motility-associated C-terminal domain-containing protein [Phaeodactylibacter sp.]|nr:gliding motility-associated C-terminal domain-containing protein [Phaeodactylibacter sp.]
MKLKINAGIAANSLISFGIETTGYGSAGCGDQVVQVAAVQRQNATCAATGELCYVLAATGSGSIHIVSEHPELSLQNLDITTSANTVSYDLTIGNAGITNTTPIQVDFYLDNDGDGMLSTGDVSVGTQIYTGVINMNETLVLSGSFPLATDQLCNLLAVIDEDNNCVCTTEMIGVNVSINVTLADEAVCSGEEIELGIPAVAGHIYQWNPPVNISTTNNSTTIFQASNTTDSALVFNFTMIDSDGNNCETMYSQAVAVLPVLGNTQQDLEICAGETITIAATLGEAYTWDGPNISNPNQPTQTVTLFENASYTVTITSGTACEGIDEININVLPFETDFSMIEKCPEEAIEIMGQMITEEGMYCDTIPNVMGCDSLICLEIINHPSLSESTYSLCEGDSVEINGATYFSATTVCNTSVSSFGCDSTHCVTIEMLEAPFAEVIGEVGNEFFTPNGVEVQLQVTDGFAAYEWSPMEGLSCTDCPNPTATLDESLEYKVTVTDDLGCTTQLLLLVTVFPPCDAQRLKIPNVFTPDGDGVNDVFGVVPYEGVERVLLVNIFNRWGEKIYQATGEDAYWDGTVNGKLATADVYVYVIRILCGDGEVEILYGDVTLIR